MVQKRMFASWFTSCILPVLVATKAGKGFELFVPKTRLTEGLEVRACAKMKQFASNVSRALAYVLFSLVKQLFDKQFCHLS